MTEVAGPIEPSARARFRALLSDLVEAHPELSSGELAELVGRTLPDEDRHLVADFLTAEARNILAWELRAHFVRNRQGIYAALDLANPDAPPVEALDGDARESVFEKIVQWREFDPLVGRSRPLLEMNKRSLLESAQYDARTVFLHGWKMQLKTKLAAALPDEESALVRDYFSPEQVLTLGESIKREMSDGHFRLKINPVQSLSSRVAVPRQADGRDSERSQDH